MAKPVESLVGVPLDAALVHTACTACRARLHHLRMLLEQSEALTIARRPQTIEKVELAVSRALKRLEAHVHVCTETLHSS